MKRYVIMIMMLVVTAALLTATTGAQEKQQKPIVPKEKMALWNGKDFTGWKLFVPDAAHDVTKTWSVKDGVICCTGRPAGYMRTEEEYADYLLHVEWRWPDRGGNNGVLNHMVGEDKVWPKSLECQLASGNAGDFWVIGGFEHKEHAKGGKRVRGRNVRKLKKSSEKPIGQ